MSVHHAYYKGWLKHPQEYFSVSHNALQREDYTRQVMISRLTYAAMAVTVRPV